MTASVTLASVTADLFNAGRAVDGVLRRSETAKQSWAQFCAMRLVGDKPSLTMEQVADAIVEQVRSRVGVRKAKAIGSIADVSKAGFGTIAGWFYDLRRVEKAGLLTRLTGPDAVPLTTLRRGTDPTTEGAKATAKGRKAKAAPATAAAQVEPSAPVSASLTMEQVAAFLEGEAKRRSAKSLADHEQGPLGRIVAASATMVRMVENHVAAQAKAKAAKATAKPRRRKAA